MIALIAVVALAQAPAVDSVVYVVSPSSRLEVRTGKSGLLGFMGHEHLIRAWAFSGRVVYYPGTPSASRVSLIVLAESLEVLTPPDTQEIRKVTAAMRTEVLDVARYPEIRFESRSVDLSGQQLHLVAALTLKGRTRELPIHLTIELGADTIRAATTFAVKQSEFGIKPFRGGPGGTVRVADRVTFDIHAIAVRQ